MFENELKTESKSIKNKKEEDKTVIIRELTIKLAAIQKSNTLPTTEHIFQVDKKIA